MMWPWKADSSTSAGKQLAKGQTPPKLWEQQQQQFLLSCPMQGLRAVMNKRRKYITEALKINTSWWTRSLLPVKNMRREGRMGKQRRRESSCEAVYWEQSYSRECRLVRLSQDELGQQNVPYKLFQLRNRLQSAYTNSFASTQIPAHLNLQPFPEQSLTLNLWFFIFKELLIFFRLWILRKHKSPLLL